MRLKCGSIVTEFKEFEDAIWEYEKDGRIEMYTHDGFLVFSIDIDDFFPLVAAIKEAISEQEKNT